MWAWGRNQVGQLGQNNTVLRSSPVQIGTETNWSKVSVAGNSILAIKTDNSLWVWGYQDQGVLGINSVTPVSSPVQVGATNVWSLISATRYHAGAIKTDGTLWTWGNNSIHGQLGLGDKVNRSSPVQLGSDTNWSQVSAGHNTTAAVKTIGTLYVWGDGRHGEMGDSSVISRSSPIQVGSRTTWTDVSVGSDDSAQAIFAISSIPF
jgi:alpha-tubulin suppressor-like RCC1 family protein